MRHWLLASILSLLGTFGTANFSTADYRPKIGEVHFDFELPRIDSRKPVKLSDYRGQKVLLLHFASW